MAPVHSRHFQERDDTRASTRSRTPERHEVGDSDNAHPLMGVMEAISPCIQAAEPREHKKGIVQKMLDIITSSSDISFMDYLLKQIELVVGYVKNFVGGVWDLVTSTIRTIFNPICSYFDKAIDKVKKDFIPAVKKFFLRHLWFTCLFVLFAFGVVGIKLISLVYGSLYGMTNVNIHLSELVHVGKLTATSGPTRSILPFMMSACGSLWGNSLDPSEEAWVNHRLRTYLLWGAVGSGVAGAATTVVKMLPIALQAYVLKHSQEGDYLEQFCVGPWMSDAAKIASSSANPEIVGNPGYRSLVDHFYDEGLKLLTKSNLKNTSFAVNTIMNDLRRVKQQIDFGMQNAQDRIPPFCIQISAPPGTGKTVMKERIVAALSDPEINTKCDIFNKSNDDEYWSGFVNKKVVVFDEWPGVTRGVAGLNWPATFLTLASSAPFYPNYASIDNPSMGQKGQYVKDVRAVLCLGNDSYPVYDVTCPDAVRSRFHVSAEWILDDKAPTVNGRIDMTSCTAEQLKDVSWLKCRLIDPLAYNQNTTTRFGTWKDFAAVLAGHYTNYRRTAIAIQAASQSKPDDAAFKLFVDSLESWDSSELENQLIATSGEEGIEKPFEPVPGTSKGAKKRAAKAKKKNQEQRNAKPNSGMTPVARAFDENSGLYCILGSDMSTISKRQTLQNMLRSSSTEFDREAILEAIEQLSAEEEPIDLREENLEVEELQRICGPAFVDDNINRPDPLEINNVEVIEDDERTSTTGDSALGSPNVFDQDVGNGSLDNKLEVSDVGQNATSDYGTPPYSVNGDDEEEATAAKAAIHELNLKRLNASIYDHGPGGFGKIDMAPPPTADMADTFQKGFGRFLTAIGYTALCGFFAFVAYIVKSYWKRFKQVDESDDDEGQELVDIEPTQDDIDFNTTLHPTYDGDDVKPRRFNRIRGFGDRGMAKMNKGKNKKMFATSGSKVFKNVCKITIGKVTQRALGIKDKWVLFNHHTLVNSDCDIGSEISLERGNGITYKEEWDENRCCYIEEQDLVFYNFSNTSLPKFANIQHLFVPFEVARRAASGRANVWYDGKPRYVQYSYSENKSYKANHNQVYQPQGVSYNTYEMPWGSCGSPGILSDGQGSLTGKVLFIHSASDSPHGGKTRSFGTMVFKEYIDDLEREGDDEPEEDLEPASKVPEPLESSAGCVQQSEDDSSDEPVIDEDDPRNWKNITEVKLADEVIYVPRTSKVKRSKISHFLPFPPEKGPPIMNESDLRNSEFGLKGDPLVNGIKRAANWPRVKLTQEQRAVFTQCKDEMVADYIKETEFPLGHKKLSLEKAILGVEGVWSGIDLTTSSGHPHMFFSKGKKGFIRVAGDDGEETSVIVDQYMLEAIANRHQDAASGKPPEVRFVAYLKDEPVRHKKIREGRTRVTYCGPMCFVIFVRKEIGAGLAALSQSYKTSSFATGINLSSFDMDQLHKFFTSHGGDKFMEGDFKAWDQSVSRELREFAFEFLGDFLKGTMGTKDEVWDYITDGCLNAEVQFGQTVVKGDLGVVSGDCLTVPSNNATNELIHRYVYKMLNPDSKVPFRKAIKLKVGGDDNESCPAQGITWNAKLFADQVSAIGLEYWPVDKEKGELSGELMNFEDITFLGMNPIKKEDKWCGARTPASLQEGLHWIKDHAIPQTVGTALEDASSRGEEFFEEFRSVLTSAMQQAELETCYIKSFKEYTTGTDCGYTPPALRTTWDFSIDPTGKDPSNTEIVASVKDGILTQKVTEWATNVGYLPYIYDLMDRRRMVASVKDSLRGYGLVDMTDKMVQDHALSQLNLMEIQGFSFKRFRHGMTGAHGRPVDNLNLPIRSAERIGSWWRSALEHRHKHSQHLPYFWAHNESAMPYSRIEELFLTELVEIWQSKEGVNGYFDMDWICEFDFSKYQDYPIINLKLRNLQFAVLGHLKDDSLLKPLFPCSSGGVLDSAEKYVTRGQDMTQFQQHGQFNTAKSFGKHYSWSKKTMTAPAMDLSFGVESCLVREELVWLSTHPKGYKLFSKTVPGGLLKSGMKNNLQNMPFLNYIFWEGDVKIFVKVNGNPFQQGMLLATFAPNSKDHGTTHVKSLWRKVNLRIHPNKNGLYEFDIPFRFFRSRWNTNVVESTDIQDHMGTFTIWVYSALISKNEQADRVELTIGTAFPNSKFSIPRPHEDPTKEQLSRGKRDVDSDEDSDDMDDYQDTVVSRLYAPRSEEGRLHATGSDEIKLGLGLVKCAYDVYQYCQSKKPYRTPGRKMPDFARVKPQPDDSKMKPTGLNMSRNNYTIGDVAGDMPIEQVTKGDLQFIPLDNPALCSGSVPIYPQFAGMSKGIGVRPCTSLQLAPQAVTRTSTCTFGIGGSETDIGFLASRPDQIGQFEWEVGKEYGAAVLDIALGPNRNKNPKLDGTFIPEWALLDMFTFYRCDFVFEIIVVKTTMHSGALRFATSYGAPKAPTKAAATTCLNQILDFSGDVDSATVRVPWECATEMLYTYNGDKTNDPVQDHLLGFASIFVANKLVAPDTVHNKVQVIVTQYLDNVKVAVPRTQRWFSDLSYEVRSPGYCSMGEVRKKVAPFVRDFGSNIGIKIGVKMTGMDTDDMVMALGKKSSAPSTVRELQPVSLELSEGAEASEPEVSNLPSSGVGNAPVGKLEHGEKLEYCVTDLADLIRRFRQVGRLEGDRTLGDIEQIFDASPGLRNCYARIPVKPTSTWPGHYMYASWKGSIIYRIFLRSHSTSVGFSVRLMIINVNSFYSPDVSQYPVCFGAGLYRYSKECGYDASSAPSAIPLEEAFCVSQGCYFLEVSVPFQNIYSWLHTGEHRAELLINYDGTGGAELEVYAAGGDDFAYGNYVGIASDGVQGPEIKKATGAVVTKMNLNGMAGTMANYC